MRKRLFSIAWGRSMLSRAAGVHYSTGRERELVETSLGLSGGFVVPIGIDMKFKRSCAPGRLDQDTTPPHQSGPYIIYVGRLDSIKNLELLIDVFDVVTGDPAFQDWRLIIAGDGDPAYVETLKARVYGKKAHQRICFVGWLNESRKRDALARAELFASFSTHESFGRSVAEAMSLGVPVLISDDVFIADDVRRYTAGWVASGSPDDFARLLRRVVSDRSERRRRSDAAKRFASEQLDMSRSAERMVACYEAILNRDRCLEYQPI
jgi:glycosyltransferase involved in cell wall biosynthesis